MPTLPLKPTPLLREGASVTGEQGPRLSQLVDLRRAMRHARFLGFMEERSSKPGVCLVLKVAWCACAEYIGQAWCMLQNTAGFDLSGHPALSVNVGFSQQPARLPIGLQVRELRTMHSLIRSIIMRQCSCPLGENATSCPH
jgi:hypothetical protein